MGQGMDMQGMSCLRKVTMRQSLYVAGVGVSDSIDGSRRTNLQD